MLPSRELPRSNAWKPGFTVVVEKQFQLSSNQSNEKNWRKRKKTKTRLIKTSRTFERQETKRTTTSQIKSKQHNGRCARKYTQRVHEKKHESQRSRYRIMAGGGSNKRKKHHDKDKYYKRKSESTLVLKFGTR